jgi:hypothetical protein
MNKEYWEEFYKKHHDMTPSPFAAFCKKWVTPKDRIIDVGCGNGRDTYYLNDYCKTDGVDQAVLPELLDTKFYKQSIDELVKKPSKYTVLYTRFLFHAISEEEIGRLLRWNNGLLCAEFRAIGDKPKIYPEHKRNFVDTNALASLLIVLGYDILFLEKGYDLAKYKDEDPYIGRVIARRN